MGIKAIMAKNALLGFSKKPTSKYPKVLYAWTFNNLKVDLDKDNLKSPVSPSSTIKDSQRIYILGLGNLGKLFATSLAQLPDPPPITLVVHQRQLLKLWNENPGLRMTRHGATTSHLNFDIECWDYTKPKVGSARQVNNGMPIQNLIIATKAFDALPSVDVARRYLNYKSNVLFVQNGVNHLWPPNGNLFTKTRWAADGKSHPNFLHAVTMHGVYSDGPFESVHASPAHIVMGPVLVSPKSDEDATAQLTNLITTAPHLEAQAVHKSELWLLQLEKLVINTIINPLTAILQVKNGALFAEPEGPIVQLMDRLLREASTVLKALVKHPDSQSIIQDSELSKTDMLERVSFEKLRKSLWEIGEKTKDNQSSMFQHVRDGKRTEIKELNGWLVATAQRIDPKIDVSTNRLLVKAVNINKTLTVRELEETLAPKLEPKKSPWSKRPLIRRITQ